jgi:hypothetical protein
LIIDEWFSPRVAKRAFLDSEVSGFAMDWHLVLAQQQSLE